MLACIFGIIGPIICVKAYAGVPPMRTRGVREIGGPLERQACVDGHPKCVCQIKGD